MPDKLRVCKTNNHCDYCDYESIYYIVECRFYEGKGGAICNHYDPNTQDCKSIDRIKFWDTTCSKMTFGDRGRKKADE